MTTANKQLPDTGSESCRVIQGGFDFGEIEGAAAAFALQPLGTWGGDSQGFTKAQHEAKLNAAGVCVLSVVGPSRPLFDECLRAEREALELQVTTQMPDENFEFRLWGGRHVERNLTDKGMQAFFDHCVAHEGADYDGIIYKVRGALTMLTASMHVPGLGSLTVRQWADAGFGLDFSLIDRDTFFLDSYLDGRPEIASHYAVWGKCYGAQKLSEAGNTIASLPTFTIAGREYVQLGCAYRHTRGEAGAWLVGSVSDWRGPTFGSYQAHIAAYDAGTVERGDHRGLLVRVRGVVCVLVSPALVYDDNAAGFTVICDDEDDEQTDEGDTFKTNDDQNEEVSA